MMPDSSARTAVTLVRRIVATSCCARKGVFSASLSGGRSVGSSGRYGVTVAAKMSRLYGAGSATPVQVSSALELVEAMPL